MLNPCKDLKELVRDFATKVLRIEDLELHYENNTGIYDLIGLNCASSERRISQYFRLAVYAMCLRASRRQIGWMKSLKCTASYVD